MTKNCKRTLLLLLTCLLTACDKPSPRQYVETAVLNTNLLSTRYTPRFFSELRELKDQDRLIIIKDGKPVNGTAVEYIRQQTIAPLKEAAAKVEALPESDDTRALKAASSDVMRYGLHVFENEYLRIAGLIDENEPHAAVDAAVQQMFNTHDLEMQKKIVHLEKLAAAYAEKHNVELEVL